MLRFASLGSGSKGNGTLVEDGSTCVLIDCGFSIRETERRLRRLNRRPEDLSAILVTHEHSDHIRGVAALARKYRIPVRLTHGTRLAADADVDCGADWIVPHRAFHLGSLSVMPVAVPHDAREPVQFVISSAGLSVGVLTDLGIVTANVIEHYSHCDGLLVEANHDTDMLASGPYPHFLKRRVGSDWGHLNNGQTAGLLSRLESARIQTLVLGHISMKNNRPSLVDEAVRPVTEGISHVSYACQDNGFSWRTVE